MMRHRQDDYEGDASACLAFMTPEGFRDLPAYVLIALEPDADVGDAVVGALTHPGARRVTRARGGRPRAGPGCGARRTGEAFPDRLDSTRTSSARCGPRWAISLV